MPPFAVSNNSVCCVSHVYTMVWLSRLGLLFHHIENGQIMLSKSQNPAGWFSGGWSCYDAYNTVWSDRDEAPVAWLETREAFKLQFEMKFYVVLQNDSEKMLSNQYNDNYNIANILGTDLTCTWRRGSSRFGRLVMKWLIIGSWGLSTARWSSRSGTSESENDYYITTWQDSCNPIGYHASLFLLLLWFLWRNLSLHWI